MVWDFVCSKAVVLLLLIFLLYIVVQKFWVKGLGCVWSLFCNAVLIVLSIDEDRVGCSCCLEVVTVLCLFLAVPWVGLWSLVYDCVISSPRGYKT